MTTTCMEPRMRSPVSRVEPARHRMVYRSNVDIIERADELTLVADLPGTTADAVDVQFENGTLTIRARVEERQPQDTDYLVREYGVGDFERTFEVGEAIDSNRISAEYRNGVLTLHLPKVESVKPRRIAVTAN